jgi:hypothetical protein
VSRHSPASLNSIKTSKVIRHYKAQVSETQVPRDWYYMSNEKYLRRAPTYTLSSSVMVDRFTSMIFSIPFKDKKVKTLFLDAVAVRKSPKTNNANHFEGIKYINHQIKESSTVRQSSKTIQATTIEADIPPVGVYRSLGLLPSPRPFGSNSQLLSHISCSSTADCNCFAKYSCSSGTGCKQYGASFHRCNP